MPTRQNAFLACAEVAAIIFTIIAFGGSAVCSIIVLNNVITPSKLAPADVFQGFGNYAMGLAAIISVIAGLFWGTTWEIVRIIRRLDMAVDIIVRNVASGKGGEAW